MKTYNSKELGTIPSGYYQVTDSNNPEADDYTVKIKRDEFYTHLIGLEGRELYSAVLDNRCTSISLLRDLLFTGPLELTEVI